MKMKYGVSIMDESFNYKLDFKSWNEMSFYSFVEIFSMVKQNIIWTNISRNILR